MNRRIIVTGLLGVLLGSGSSQALYLDEKQTIQVTGKVFTQTSLRMENSDSGGIGCYPFGENCTGFTFPNTKAGQLIQNRNLLDLEWFHDVGKMLGPQFTLLDQLDYRLRVKYFYDGLYDYGPKQYSQAATAFGANIVPGADPTQAFIGHSLDEILHNGLIQNRYLDTQKNPLWNAYVDIGRNPVKVRIGRQDLSWGETDGFRLLDMVEPLDNRFGFPLVEDLDDRRIPLWMLRPTVTIGTIGPVQNLTVDGYWVPGTIDNSISPVAQFGNPFAVGAPPGPSTTFRPNKDMGNSRGGGRIIGTAGSVTFSIAHYVTFNDIPSLRLKVNSINLPLITKNGQPDYRYFAPDGAFQVNFYQQQITGGSATFALPFDPYTIVRMETALFWDERIFTADANINSAVVNCVPGADGRCTQSGLGALPTKDVMRWMIGLDRNVWIRWLNPENTFFFSAQYFHTNIFDYDSNIANGVPSATHLVPTGQMVPIDFNDPSLGLVPVKADIFDWVPRTNDEITFTYLINTLVYHGNIQPQVFGAYDIRGVNAVVPSVSYQLGTNIQMTVKYALISGTYANLGFFRDRDELLFRVQYNLS